MSLSKKLKCVTVERTLNAHGVTCEVLELDFDTANSELAISARIQECFASSEHIRAMALELSLAEIDVLKTKLLPTDPKIVSGDFGEILFQFLFEKIESLDFFHYRWRHKYTRNESIRGSDLIGCSFENKDHSPSSNDNLYIIEVKCGWTSQNKKIVEKAYKGIDSDINGRIGTSLFAILRRKLDLDKNADTSDIKRFMDSQNKPFQTVPVIAIGKSKAVWDDDFFNSKQPTKTIPKRAMVVLFDEPWDKVKNLIMGTE